MVAMPTLQEFLDNHLWPHTDRFGNKLYFMDGAVYCEDEMVGIYEHIWVDEDWDEFHRPEWMEESVDV